jgi:hypothetical protein
VGVVVVDVGVVFGVLVALFVGCAVALLLLLLFGVELKKPEKTTTGTSMTIIRITARIANKFLRDFAEGGGGGGGKFMLSFNFRVRLFFNIQDPLIQNLNIILFLFFL